METAMLIIGIILLVFAVFLVVAVLMQQGKAHNLSGAIAGGAETFFGKSKAQTINKKLSILTTIVAIVFVLLVSSVYVMQDSGKSLDDYDNFWEVINPFNDDVKEDAHDDKDEAKNDKDEAKGDKDDAKGEDDKNGGEAVPHDHDGDGKPDHDAEDHVDEDNKDTDNAENSASDDSQAA